MAKRRSNGEGSIRKRKDGRWEGRYTAGHDPDGRAIVKNVLGRTQAEVREKMKNAIAECEQLDIKRSGAYTVEEWLKEWYEVYCRPNLRDSTARYYEMFTEKHLIPALGDIPLNKLSTTDIQKLYNELRDNGRVRHRESRGTGLSASYIRGMNVMLHSCLECAMQQRLILRNPTDGCKLPKLQKKEMKVLTQEQLGMYLKAAEEREVLPMFFLELSCGLRKSELAALLWSDVDGENKTVTVSKQLARVDGELVLQAPKTENSVRRIAISDATLNYLQQEHARHPGNPVLFPSPRTGKMYYPDSIVNIHKKILKDAGLPYIRFHDLRHTFATLALQNGVDPTTLSGMLGHSDAGFTLRTYTHVTRKSQEQAAATMGNILSGAL